MVIPAEVWNAEISAKAMILYGHISVLANKEKYCFASNSYFTNVMKCSIMTLSRIFNELESKELITRELTYKEDSKEVDIRKIYLNVGISKSIIPINEIDNTLLSKSIIPPIIENDKDNSTRDNNKIKDNNTASKTQLSNELKVFNKWLSDEFLIKYPKRVRKNAFWNAVTQWQEDKQDWNVDQIRQVTEHIVQHLKLYLKETESKFICSPVTYFESEKWLEVKYVTQEEKMKNEMNERWKKKYDQN
jgi:hypothetical protein